MNINHLYLFTYLLIYLFTYNKYCYLYIKQYNVSYVYLNSSILSLYFKNKEDKMINIE